MQGGDLGSDTPAPHVAVVWEGLIVLPGDHFTQKRFARRVRARRYRAAVALLQPNPAALDALWNLWTAGQPVTVLTYLPSTLLPAIARDLDTCGAPHTRLLHTTEQHMARTIALRTDMAMVYDADPARALMYGPKGRAIRPELAAIMQTPV